MWAAVASAATTRPEMIRFASRYTTMQDGANHNHDASWYTLVVARDWLRGYFQNRTPFPVFFQPAGAINSNPEILHSCSHWLTYCNLRPHFGPLAKMVYYRSSSLSPSLKKTSESSSSAGRDTEVLVDSLDFCWSGWLLHNEYQSGFCHAGVETCIQSWRATSNCYTTGTKMNGCSKTPET